MQTIHIPAGELVDALARCKHSISNEETRYYLTGVHVRPAKGGAFLQSTDGHRLTRVKIDGDFPAFKDFIMSRQSVADIQKNVKRRHHNSVATIALGEETKVCLPGLDDIPVKLIDGTFPDCDHVIPALDDTKTVGLDTKAFVQAVAAIHGFASGAGHDAIKLTFADDKLTLSANANCSADVTGFAQVTMPCNCGDLDGPFVIGFNGRYLAEYAKRLESGGLKIHLSDPESPTRFSGAHDSDKHETFVLMPMRV